MSSAISPNCVKEQKPLARCTAMGSAHTASPFSSTRPHTANLHTSPFSTSKLGGLGLFIISDSTPVLMRVASPKLAKPILLVSMDWRAASRASTTRPEVETEASRAHSKSPGATLPSQRRYVILPHSACAPQPHIASSFLVSSFDLSEA